MKKHAGFLFFALAAALICAAALSPARAAQPGVFKTAPQAAFAGSWYDIGRQVGSTYPDQVIEFGWTMKIALLFAGPGRGWTPQAYYDAIRDELPQSIRDHLQGLADGLAGARPISPRLAWDLVLTQNFAIELINMKSNMDPVPELVGCTGFAVSSPAGTFLCHNTDAQASANNLLALMYWAPTNGDYGYLTFDPPGWADVSFGLNDRGIGVNLNAGSPNTDASIGLPPNFMLRTVMEHAATLDEAVAFFKEYLAAGKAFGTSGTLAHIVDFNDGTMAKLQVRSQALEVSYGETTASGATYVASANHFTGDFSPDPDYYYESSFERYERLLELIGATATFDLAGCYAILQDTDGGEATNNTISRVSSSSGTIMSTIFTADGLYYTVGPPHLYFTRFGGPQYVALSDLAASDLVSFRARGGLWRAALSWQVADGAGITGVNLYRAENQDGPYAPVQAGPLPAGTGTGSAHTDWGLKNGRTYYYRIELRYEGGGSKTFGFVQAKPKLFGLLGAGGNG